VKVRAVLRPWTGQEWGCGQSGCQEVGGCKEPQQSEVIYKVSCKVAFLRCYAPNSPFIVRLLPVSQAVGASKKLYAQPLVLDLQKSLTI
jgi:hypothetical protein